MTLTFAPEIESALKEEAARHGIEAEDYALDLFARWAREDATDDPAELARRQQEGEEFMQNLARNRMEMEGPNARKLWP
jgi:hypothetical protein